jgi:hypothetical protein
MANNIAFQAMGNTVAVLVNGTANVQSNVFTITATSPVNQYCVVNADPNNNVYIWINPTNNFNVALPETVSNLVHALPAYGYRVVTGPQCGPNSPVYARVIGEGANACVYVQPGEGL